MDIFLSYLTIINAIGFSFMLVDKRRAQKKRWRIPESTLIGIAVIGGSAGTLLGMYTFRHKTRHIKFTIGVPVILALQLALAAAIFIAA
ncbi:MAG: DUF1294 domain-containing protein [Oscillospiraceae bacterium]|nr:DUF1294 domain-containing protein [Oscillospiraceae bacterium]